MRKPHYWKSAGAASAPSEIVVVDTESWRNREVLPNGSELHNLDIGYAIAYRLDKGRRTRIRDCSFNRVDTFWSFLEDRLCRHRPVWLFGHNLAFDMGILKGWARLTSRDVTCSRIVIDGGNFFMRVSVAGRTLWLCDTFNYYRMSLKKLGECMGMRKGDIPFERMTDKDWRDYVRQDVMVTASAVDALIEFAREHELGPWQPTVSSTAFAALRSRFLDHKVLVHCYGNALKIERGAYFGGAVDTPFVGRVPVDDVHEYDVHSMYPSVCMSDLPCCITGWSDSMGLAALGRLLRQRSAVASVTLRSRGYRYPVRFPDRTVYPVGRFSTSLAGAELIHAYESGDITDVHSVAWYKSAPIFARYMGYFYRLKSSYSADYDKPFRTITKLLLNGLYGKTGQLSPRWVPWGKDAMRMIEITQGLTSGSLDGYEKHPPATDKCEDWVTILQPFVRLRVRNYFGTWEVGVGSHESRDSCPVIAATVTSAARMRLRSFQDIAGSKNWYYSDTDSVWVSDAGEGRLKRSGNVHESNLGQLGYAGTHNSLIIHGPKDYESTKVVKRKGVRPTAEPTLDGGWQQLHFPSAKQQLGHPEWGGVLIASVVKHLTRRVEHCHVGSDGWTTPLVLPDDLPVKKSRKKA